MRTTLSVAAGLVAGLVAALGAAQESAPATLELELARWQEPSRVVVLAGTAAPDAEVVVTDAYSGERLGDAVADEEGRFLLRLSDPDPVPCAVLVEVGEAVAEAEVTRAPADCGRPGGGAPVPVALTITGPATVAELATARYRAVALYSDGSTQVVTALARWEEASPWAQVDEGLLRTQEVTGDQETLLTATFTVEQVTVEGTHAVAILDEEGAPQLPRGPDGPDDDY